MEREAAYQLFTRFLEERGIKGIDLNKELPGLLAYGQSRGLLVNPHSVHELSEWRKFGDVLWEATIEDNKVARKLGKLWKAVHNELLQSQGEKRAAQQVVGAHQRNEGYGNWLPAVPPAVSTIVIPAERAAGSEPVNAPAVGSGPMTVPTVPCGTINPFSNCPRKARR